MLVLLKLNKQSTFKMKLNFFDISNQDLVRKTIKEHAVWDILALVNLSVSLPATLEREKHNFPAIYNDYIFYTKFIFGLV